MADSANTRLTKLRELVLSARSVPLSDSCVVNRRLLIEALDAIAESLPAELAEAQHLLAQRQATIDEAEEAAAGIISDARSKASQLAEDSEVVLAAAAMAASVKAEAESEAAALRRETDLFIDSRMASFESVLHKTSSQVRTARSRLSERSALD